MAGEIQSALPPGPAGATGAQPGPDGSLHWHDVSGKDLGPVPQGAEKPEAISSAPQDPFTALGATDAQKPQQDPFAALGATDASVSKATQDPFAALGATSAEAAPQKPEEIGKLHKLWNWLNEGIISKDTILDVLQRASATGKYQDVTTTRFHPTVHIPGFGDIDTDTLQSGVQQSSAGVTSSLTSPLSIALFVTGAAAGKAGSAALEAKALQAADVAKSTVTAADAVLTARTGEVARAATQANDARLAAEAAEAAEKAGTGSKAATIAAQNTASEAAANAVKAQEALKSAQLTRAENAVEAAKASRDAAKAAEVAKKAGTLGKLSPEAGKAAQTASRVAGVGFGAAGAKEALTGRQEGESLADELERRLMGAGFATLGAAGELRGTAAAEGPISELPAKTVEAAGKVGDAWEKWHQEREAKKADLSADAISGRKDFRKSIPPSQAAPYDENDETIGDIYLEHHHANVAPINGVEDTRDALEYERAGIENQVRNAAAPYAKESLDIGDKPHNVKMDVMSQLLKEDKVKSGTLEKGLAALEDYNLTDPTIEEAFPILRKLNSENRAILNGKDVQTARDTDPAFLARELAAESLRNGIYNKLESKGVKGIREKRLDESSLIRLRNAAQRQVFSGDKVARGSSEVGPVRKGMAKLATGAGAGFGALAGGATGIPGAGEVGAAVGAGLGRKAGEVIAPPDLTRDQLIQRRMSKKIATGTPTEITSTGAPSNPPVEPTPKTPFSELMIPELQKLRGEFTTLHSDLATHYGESLGDTPYGDLEEKFLSDVAIKKQHKVPLDPAEKKLLAGINQAKVDEALQARGMAEEQRKAAQKAAEEAQKQKEEKEKQGLITEMAPPFETEPHREIPEEWRQRGESAQRAAIHELGHHFQAAKYGNTTLDVIDHEHPSIGKKALAQARWDSSKFEDENGNLDFDKVADNIDEILDIYHGGPVADEIVNGIPIRKNYGAGSDLSRMENLWIMAGFTPSEAAQLMMASELRVRKDFTTPGVSDIFKKYTQAREAGLRPGLLMSGRTSGKAIQEFKNALGGGNEGGNEPTNIGKAGRSGGEGKAGRAGAASGKGAEGTRPAGKEGASSGGARTNIEGKEKPSITEIIPTLAEHPEIAKQIKDLGFESILQKAWMEQRRPSKVPAGERPTGQESGPKSADEPFKHHEGEQ